MSGTVNSMLAGAHACVTTHQVILFMFKAHTGQTQLQDLYPLLNCIFAHLFHTFAFSVIDVSLESSLYFCSHLYVIDQDGIDPLELIA